MTKKYYNARDTVNVSTRRYIFCYESYNSFSLLLYTKDTFYHYKFEITFLVKSVFNSKLFFLADKIICFHHNRYL